MANRFNIPNYVKNAKRSTKMLAKDQLKQLMPNLGSTVVNNREAFREMKSFDRNNSRTMSAYVKRQKQYVFGTFKDFIHNAKSDLKSGKFYNEERQDNNDLFGSGLDSMLDGFGDMGDNGLMSEEEMDGVRMTSKFDKYLKSTGSGLISGRVLSDSLNEVSINNADYIANVNTVNNTKLMAITTKNHMEQMKQLKNLESIGMSMVKFNQEVVAAGIERQTQFYDEILNETRELKDLIREQTELNLSRFKGKGSNGSKFGKLEQILGSNGIDIKAYLDNVKGNARNLSPIGGDMVKMLIDGTKNNPVGSLLQLVLPALLGKNITSSMKNLDKGIQGIFSSYLLGLNKLKHNGKNNIARTLAELLGVDMTMYNKPNLAIYKNRDIDLEMEQKKAKAITEVIPQYLSKITESMTGVSKVFDYSRGRFVDKKKARKELDTDYKNAIAADLSDTGDTMKNYMYRAMGKGISKEQMDFLEEDLLNFKVFLGLMGEEYKPNMSYSYCKSKGLKLEGGQTSYKMFQGIVSKMRSYERATLKNEQSRSMANRIDVNSRRDDNIFHSGLGVLVDDFDGDNFYNSRNGRIGNNRSYTRSGSSYKKNKNSKNIKESDLAMIFHAIDTGSDEDAAEAIKEVRNQRLKEQGKRPDEPSAIDEGIEKGKAKFKKFTDSVFGKFKNRGGVVAEFLEGINDSLYTLMYGTNNKDGFTGSLKEFSNQVMGSTKKLLFGEINPDERMENTKGILPKPVADLLQKYLPKTKNGLVVGGLLGKTLHHPLIGAVSGAAINILMETDKVKRFLWGDENDKDSKGIFGGIKEYMKSKLFDPIKEKVKTFADEKASSFFETWDDEEANGKSYKYKGVKDGSLKDIASGFRNRAAEQFIADEERGIYSNQLDHIISLLAGQIRFTGHIAGKDEISSNLVSTCLKTPTSSVNAKNTQKEITKQATKVLKKPALRLGSGRQEETLLLNPGIDPVTGTVIDSEAYENFVHRKERRRKKDTKRNAKNEHDIIQLPDGTTIISSENQKDPKYRLRKTIGRKDKGIQGFINSALGKSIKGGSGFTFDGLFDGLKGKFGDKLKFNGIGKNQGAIMGMVLGTALLGNPILGAIAGATFTGRTDEQKERVGKQKVFGTAAKYGMISSLLGLGPLPGMMLGAMLPQKKGNKQNKKDQVIKPKLLDKLTGGSKFKGTMMGALAGGLLGGGIPGAIIGSIAGNKLTSGIRKDKPWLYDEDGKKLSPKDARAKKKSMEEELKAAKEQKKEEKRLKQAKGSVFDMLTGGGKLRGGAFGALAGASLFGPMGLLMGGLGGSILGTNRNKLNRDKTGGLLSKMGHWKGSVLGALVGNALLGPILGPIVGGVAGNLLTHKKDQRWWRYDENGKLLNKEDRKKQKEAFKNEYTYDEDGNKRSFSDRRAKRKEIMERENKLRDDNEKKKPKKEFKLEDMEMFKGNKAKGALKGAQFGNAFLGPYGAMIGAAAGFLTHGKKDKQPPTGAPKDPIYVKQVTGETDEERKGNKQLSAGDRIKQKALKSGSTENLLALPPGADDRAKSEAKAEYSANKLLSKATKDLVKIDNKSGDLATEGKFKDIATDLARSNIDPNRKTGILNTISNVASSLKAAGSGAVAAVKERKKGIFDLLDNFLGGNGGGLGGILKTLLPLAIPILLMLFGDKLKDYLNDGHGKEDAYGDAQHAGITDNIGNFGKRMLSKFVGSKIVSKIPGMGKVGGFLASQTGNALTAASYYGNEAKAYSDKMDGQNAAEARYGQFSNIGKAGWYANEAGRRFITKNGEKISQRMLGKSDRLFNKAVEFEAKGNVRKAQKYTDKALKLSGQADDVAKNAAMHQETGVFRGKSKLYREAFSNAGNGIMDWAYKNASDEVLETATKKAVKKAGKEAIEEGAETAIQKAARKGTTELAERAARKAGGEVVENALSTAVAHSDDAGKVVKGVGTFLEKLGKNSRVAKLLKKCGKGISSVISSVKSWVSTKLANLLVKKAGGLLGKILGKVAQFASVVMAWLPVITAVTAFINGWNNVANELQLSTDYEPEWWERLTCALVYALDDFLCGAIDMFGLRDNLINLLIGLFGGEKKREEIASSKAKATEEYEKFLKENDLNRDAFTMEKYQNLTNKTIWGHATSWATGENLDNYKKGGKKNEKLKEKYGGYDSAKSGNPENVQEGSTTSSGGLSGDVGKMIEQIKETAQAYVIQDNSVINNIYGGGSSSNTSSSTATASGGRGSSSINKSALNALTKFTRSGGRGSQLHNFTKNLYTNKSPRVNNYGSGGRGSASDVVAKMLSLEGKFTYSYGAVPSGDSGTTDCSALQQYVYKTAGGMDIGRDTSAQMGKGTVVDKGSSPDTSKLQPGDLVFYNNHVEMYMGNDEVMGIGSGTGPKKRSINYRSDYIQSNRYLEGGSSASTNRTSALSAVSRTTTNSSGGSHWDNIQNKYRSLRASTVEKDQKDPATTVMDVVGKDSMSTLFGAAIDSGAQILNDKNLVNNKNIKAKGNNAAKNISNTFTSNTRSANSLDKQNGLTRNNKQSFWSNVGNTVKNIGSSVWGGVKKVGKGIASGVKKGWDWFTGLFDGGRGEDPDYYNQQDPRWGNMSFGRYDNHRDTVADGGCGPTTAATVLQKLTGQKITPAETSKFALQNGFKVDDGGTTPDYFNALGSKYGVGFNQSDPSSRETISSLQQGKPVVFLGHDYTGTSPFGNDSHYVVGTGMDRNGNISILDPKNQMNNRTYNINDIASNAMQSIVPNVSAGRGRVKRCRTCGGRNNTSARRHGIAKSKFTKYINSFKSVFGGRGSSTPNIKQNLIPDSYSVQGKKRCFHKGRPSTAITCDDNPNYNFSEKGIAYIVLHYTGDDTDENNNYGGSGGTWASMNSSSAHYVVHPTYIEQNVADSDTAFHCRGTDGKGPYYNKCFNENSIGIEQTVSGGTIREATLEQSRQLVSWLMAKYDIPLDHVIRHGDVTTKHCPKQFYGSSSKDTAWNNWKNTLNPKDYNPNYTGKGGGTSTSGGTNSALVDHDGFYAPILIHGFPYYEQHDSRWGNKDYGGNTMAGSGCGPTSMAMVLTSYGISIDPPTAADYSLKNNFRVAGEGTSWGYFKSIGEANGLSVEQFSDYSKAEKSLQSNIPVVASMKAGHFTKGGHFIVLSGYQNGKILVSDPSRNGSLEIPEGKDRSNTPWDPNIIKSEAVQYWAVSKNGVGSIGNVGSAGGGGSTGSTRGTTILDTVLNTLAAATGNSVMETVLGTLSGNSSSSGSQSSSVSGSVSGNDRSAGFGTTDRVGTVTVPSGLGTSRSYMGWQCIKDKSSDQYKLREESGMNFDSEGYAKIGDRYVVAMTDTYGKVGDYVDIKRSDGSVLHAVIGDIKDQTWAHGTPANKWGHDNGKTIEEFVVDKNTWYSGNKGSHSNPGNKGNHEEWSGLSVTSVENLGNYWGRGGRGDSTTAKKKLIDRLKDKVKIKSPFGARGPHVGMKIDNKSSQTAAMNTIPKERPQYTNSDMKVSEIIPDIGTLTKPKSGGRGMTPIPSTASVVAALSSKNYNSTMNKINDIVDTRKTKTNNVSSGNDSAISAHSEPITVNTTNDVDIAMLEVLKSIAGTLERIERNNAMASRVPSSPSTSVYAQSDKVQSYKNDMMNGIVSGK